MKPECETRQKLLTAATDLMWERSYAAVSVDDICARSGVRKGSFYYFFPSKCDLVVAAIEQQWCLKQPMYDAVFSSTVEPMERIEKLCDFIYSSQCEKQQQYGKICGCPYFTLAAEMSTQEEKIRVKVEAIIGRFIKYLETLVQDLVDKGDLAPVDATQKAGELLAFISGILLQAKVQNSPEPLKGIRHGMFLLLGLVPEAVA